MTAADTGPGDHAPGMGLLLFRIGREQFAAPLAAVEEALDLPADAVQAMPGENPALRGVFSLRGALVPVFDPHRVLGIRTEAGSTALIVRDAGGAGRAAIAVDDVEDVLTVTDAEIRHAAAGAHADAILRGVVQRGSAVIGIVDLQTLVAACRDTGGGERI